MDVWAHTISLTPPLFIEVPVSSQESAWACSCVLMVSMLPLKFCDSEIKFWNCSHSIHYWLMWTSFFFADLNK